MSTEVVVASRAAESMVLSPPDPAIIALCEPPAWADPRHLAVAWAIADGSTRREAAEAGGVHEDTVYTWLREPDYRGFVDRLTVRTGIATSAGRVAEIKKLFKRLGREDIDVSLRKHDAVDLIRLAREETEQGPGKAVAGVQVIAQYAQFWLNDKGELSAKDE